MEENREASEQRREIDEVREKHCELSLILNTRMTDFIARYERDLKKDLTWKEQTGMTLYSISDSLTELKQPYNLGKWIAATIIGSIILATGVVIVEWVKKHIQ